MVFLLFIKQKPYFRCLFLSTEFCIEMPFNVKVGVTSDPKTKRSYYQNQIKGYCNWQIIETYTCRDEAQEYANLYSCEFECELDSKCTESGPIFYVYRLEYQRQE